MATLNIKNLPDGLYEKLKARAKRQHRSVAQEVTRILAETLAEPERVSIHELRGLGKEHWQGVDAMAHVERERQARAADPDAGGETPDVGRGTAARQSRRRGRAGARTARPVRRTRHSTGVAHSTTR